MYFKKDARTPEKSERENELIIPENMKKIPKIILDNRNVTVAKAVVKRCFPNVFYRIHS